MRYSMLKTLSVAFALVGVGTLCAAFAVAQVPEGVQQAEVLAASLGVPPGAIKIADGLVALAVLLLPTIIVGVTKYRRDGLGGAVMWLLDRASLAVHTDSPGSLKLPLVQGSKDPEAPANDEKRGGGIAAVAILIFAGAVLPAAHCPSVPAGEVGPMLVDVGACVVGDACGGIVGPLVESIAAAAMHAQDAEWNKVVDALKSQTGKCAGCLWAAVGSRLHNQAPVAPAVPAQAICKAAVAGDQFVVAGRVITTGEDTPLQRALAEARIKAAVGVGGTP